MKKFLAGAFAIILLTLSACAPTPAPQEPVQELKVVTIDTAAIAMGQTIYVPVYSHIYSPDQTQQMNLTAILSVRNTDLANPIIIAAVNYYNTSGERVRQYLEQPVELRPLAATSFVVDRDDTAGGSGASFVVEWVSQTPVSDPVVEAVMINTAGNQGLSLVSPGRVIKTRSADRP
ncbi:MAG: DUF3124 domain-containing protein [Microcoleus sp. SIO2G3]|nr:DUF3124 domain-containing protein [Microcoleus sp. SIO2G3]